MKRFVVPTGGLAAKYRDSKAISEDLLFDEMSRQRNVELPNASSQMNSSGLINQIFVPQWLWNAVRDKYYSME